MPSANHSSLVVLNQSQNNMHDQSLRASGQGTGGIELNNNYFSQSGTRFSKRLQNNFLEIFEQGSAPNAGTSTQIPKGANSASARRQGNKKNS